MCFKKLGKSVFIVAILGFVAGLLMAFFLPPTVIAIIECVLIIVLCIILRK